VEERAYQQRKLLFDYDDILNQQRKIVFFERRQILKSISSQNNILAYGEQIITDILLELQNEKALTTTIILCLENLFGKNLSVKYVKNINSLLDQFSLYELQVYLFNEFWLVYQSKINQFAVYGKEMCQSCERTIILENLDRIWREHLQTMTLLREAVGWRGYGQRNPLYEYKQEAFYIFENRNEMLRHLIIYDLLRAFIL
jgi:preprotein translocase subunit SecA